MIALKALPLSASVHDLARLQARAPPGLGSEAPGLSLGGERSFGRAKGLLGALPVAIYTTDAEGWITFFNEAAAALWGQRPVLGADRYCGSWRMLAAGGEVRPRDRCPLAIALETGAEAAGTETIAERPDGTRVTVAHFPTLLRDAQGRVTGAIAMLVDVTRAKELEAGLRESEAQGRSAGDHGAAEYRFRRADGSYAHVFDRDTLIRDESGRVVRPIGAMLDRSEHKGAEEALRLSEERLRAAETASSLASDAAEHIAWDLDVVQDVVTWSAPLQRRFGLWPDPSESNRAWWRNQIHPDDQPRISAFLASTMAGTSNSLLAEYRFRRADGTYAHVLDRGSLVRNDEGQAVRAIGAMIDLTERRGAEQALRLSEERFRFAASAAGLGVADIDLVTGEEHWSTELRAILGVSERAVAGPETYTPLIHADDRAAASARHYRALRGDFARKSKSVHRIVRANDGAIRWLETERHAIRNDEGAVVRIIITNKDITEEKTAQDRINWAATHDAVTGLPNRTVFQARLEKALARGRDKGEPVSLLLIDLDNFKLVNDSLGHQAGDRALAAFAGRIGEAMPAGAIVVRFGGDEFAVILPDADIDAAATIAGVLTRNLQRPSSIGDRNVDLRASIGAAAFPVQGNSATDLVQNADLALYAAKAGGGATVRTFEPALRARLQGQLSMLTQARAALDNGWIRPFYQPKIALATGRTAGFEALLRWRDPKTGLKLPATIACAFDDTELAGLIGEAMVLAVLADMRRWIGLGLDFGKIAINASAAEFREPGFADRLLARMADFGVPPALLELEITETAFLGDCAANVVVALEALRAAGMTIALDDFGTGFSSLSHLRNFPVDAIKIDRSFVAGLGDAEYRAIIEAIIRLGGALGMTTVAEGIETQTQADYLRRHGCTLAQGFLFAPALAAAEVPTAAATRYAHGETRDCDGNEVDRLLS